MMLHPSPTNVQTDWVSVGLTHTLQESVTSEYSLCPTSASASVGPTPALSLKAA